MPAPDQAGPDHIDRRRGEHRAADRVEVAGDDVEQVDRPLAYGTELVGRDAHSPVGNTAVRCRELMGDSFDVGCRDAAHLLRERRSEGRDCLLHLGQPIGVRGCLRSTFDEEHVEHREQHPRIRPGPNEVVLFCDLRGLGATWVEDHHPSAALLQLAEPVGEVGDRHQ